MQVVSIYNLFVSLHILDPAYFARPLTSQSVKHLRLGEALTEQRPLRPACPKPCRHTSPGNPGNPGDARSGVGGRGDSCAARFSEREILG